jgi:hypothetical protein
VQEARVLQGKDLLEEEADMVEVEEVEQEVQEEIHPLIMPIGRVVTEEALYKINGQDPLFRILEEEEELESIREGLIPRLDLELELVRLLSVLDKMVPLLYVSQLAM